MTYKIGTVILLSFITFSLSAQSWETEGTNRLFHAGPVIIGTLNIGEIFDEHLLLVDGSVMCKEVNIELSDNWADYVFSPNYQRLSLEDLANYIEQNGHLPGVASAKEVSAAGAFDLSVAIGQLLEKVEELTLYLIEDEQRDNSLLAQLRGLETIPSSEKNVSHEKE